MCGIAGKVDFTGAPVERELVDRMCATLVHRGPDGQGIHTGPGIGLGQRRLAIIDLNPRGVAPMPNEDETIWLTFNGEIYNFQELRAELEGRGHRFRTSTDTEVIVHLYEEHGVECLQRLRGMFAFALWDAPRRRFFAARDRLGEKPFCYARTTTSLVFGSEIKAILADPSISVEPDFGAIDAYLTYQYVPSPSTAFAGISRLPAAHYLVCDASGRVDVGRYWEPPAHTPSTRPAAELREELQWRLREAVRLRLVADVPVGAFLSGGIDSGAVVALMAQESDRPVRTFSIGFEDASYDELPFARQVAERYGTEHHELVVRPDAADVLPRLVHFYNEPFADSSAIPTYYVSKATREHVTVALTGDGGDESFAGYENYRAVAAWQQYDVIPQPIRQAMARGVTSVTDRLPYSTATARASRGARMWAGPLPSRFALQSTIFKPEEKQAAYTAGFQATLDAGARRSLDLEWDEAMDTVAWMTRHDQHYYLPDCLMVKTDIASMANSLEVRCPLLDHPLVEFAATVPSGMKQQGGEGKRILKEAVRDLLPAAVLTKPKTGFAVPLARWLREEDLFDLLRGTLLDDRARRRALFEPAFVSRLVDEHRGGRRDWSARLWALLFLELWFREFID